ncbi:MAG TPA: glycosyltransferase family 4 protein [Sphingomicrobium sp.]|nr:glycosyltransferase family 4 protein [Sphingomicrobium sp.]
MQEIQRHAAARRPGGSEKTILISANSCWNVVNFRAGLIRALRKIGYRVVVAAPDDQSRPRLADLGTHFVPVPIDSSGISVVADLRLLARYLRVFQELRPSAFLGFTAKPNIYGSLAARAVGAKIINNVSGLGTVFIKQGPLTALVTQLYRIAFRASATVFFQNRDDLELFVGKRIARRGQAQLLPGSGVDLERFKPPAAAAGAGPFRFLLVGRLLWDKGVGEYVEAARIVRRSYPQARFQLLGPAGANNRTAIPSAVLDRWQDEEIIDYLGESDDVRTAMEQADCVVLPSYREGLPRALLEGSAMGKPLIATDVPGCRDVVVDGNTGYLCKERSADSLAAAMVKMIETPASERLSMGALGRRKIEQEFCETRVIAKYLEALGAG